MTSTQAHRMVFVAGLHRSGTTPLARALAGHPQVSGFAGTGVPEDEGQHLQRVYRSGREHGAQGRFALDPSAHLTEDDARPGQADQLTAAWSRYWDLSRPVLLEKSPPNLVRMRYLQALFPGARFVAVVRHPAMVALGTSKWARGATWSTLLENWVVAHETFAADAPRVEHLAVVRYERLVADPQRELAGLGEFLGLDDAPSADGLQPGRSLGYQLEWAAWARSANPLLRRRHRRLVRRFSDRVRALGYDLDDPTACPGPVVGERVA